MVLVFFIVPATYPHALKAASVGVSYAGFTWRKLHIRQHNGFLSNYLLVLNKKDEEENSYDFAALPNEDSGTITHLEPDTEYSIKIAAVNLHGRGKFSAPVTFRTKGSKIFKFIHIEKTCKDSAALCIYYF